MAAAKLGLTLGPVLFLWDEQRWQDFYFRIADEADVDTVVLGEVVCSKRDHFHQASMPQVIQRLTAAGKRVRLATLGLVTLERERKAVRKLAEQGAFAVEVGELSAVAALAGRPHTVGPLVNVYNAATAKVLAANGAKSICLPPELPRASIETIVRGTPGMEFEVFAFGRVPLAISARCAHARIKGLTKDNCQFVCGNDPDGLAVDTLDEQQFLALNGVQTMSSACLSLLGDVASLKAAGVSSLRLSPQVCDMVEVARLFRGVADGRIRPMEAMAGLVRAYPGSRFSNGFFHGAPGHEFVG